MRLAANGRPYWHDVWLAVAELRREFGEDYVAFIRLGDKAHLERYRDAFAAPPPAPKPATPVSSTAPGAPQPPPATPPRPLDQATVDAAIDIAWANPVMRARFGSREELAEIVRTGGASIAPAPTSRGIDPRAPIEQRAEAEWRASADLRASFGGDDRESLRRYVALRRAEERGRGGSVHRGDAVRAERSAS